MSYVTVNGFVSVESVISIPRLGAWHGDFLVDSAAGDGLTGPLTISLAGGAVTLRGTAMRSGVFAGYVKVRAVGGTGGLRKFIVPPKGYQAVPLQRVLNDIVTGAGETLSSAADSGLLAMQLASWAQIQQPAGAALLSLLKTSPSSIWRMLFDGTLWVGYETWPVVDSLLDYVLLTKNTAFGRFEIASEVPTLAPGQTFLGKQISYVTHYFEPDEIKSIAYWES